MSFLPIAELSGGVSGDEDPEFHGDSWATISGGRICCSVDSSAFWNIGHLPAQVPPGVDRSIASCRWGPLRIGTCI